MAKNWNDQQAAEAEERRKKMAALKKQGWTYAAIGRRFGGITRQRARAIIMRGVPA
jgi:hypothetical protein